MKQPWKWFAHTKRKKTEIKPSRIGKHTNMEQQLTRIAVKIGSNVLTRRDGTLDVTRMSALVDHVDVYKRQARSYVCPPPGSYGAN